MIISICLWFKILSFVCFLLTANWKFIVLETFNRSSCLERSIEELNSELFYFLQTKSDFVLIQINISHFAIQF